MKRNTEATELLNNLVSEFGETVDEIKGRSSLIVAAFVEAQPETPAAPAAEPAHSGRPVLRIRIPERARSRLSTAEKREASMPVDSPDPIVHRLLTGLNGYHLWLMAEAVGAVSRYYRSLFPVLGYLDPETWPCSSYGDIRMSEVCAKPLAWFEEKGAAFVEAQGMVAVADALTDAVPALKHSADVKTPPGVWFRGADLFLRLIEECHGNVPEVTMDEWFRAAGVEANEALRVLGVLSCIRVHGDEATLWLIDTAQGQGADHRFTKRFESVLGRAEECVSAGHSAAMEHFGFRVVTSLPAPVIKPQQEVPPPPQQAPSQPAPQPPAAQPKPGVPKGKDPAFVPIRLQEPAGRFRPVKGPKP